MFPPPRWVWYPHPDCLSVYPLGSVSGWQVSGRSIEDSENVLGELSCRQVLRVKFTLNLFISGHRDGRPGGHKGGKGGRQATGCSHFRSTDF